MTVPHKWGTVGSGLNPRSWLDVQTTEMQENFGKMPKKNGKFLKNQFRPFCSILSAKPRHLQILWGYLQIGLDLRIILVPSKFQNSRSQPSKGQKTSFPVLPYSYSTRAQQTTTGCLRIGLDPLMVPKNPNFRSWISWKTQKTWKKNWMGLNHVTPNFKAFSMHIRAT